jgi:serine/threonine-protein kinase
VARTTALPLGAVPAAGAATAGAAGASAAGAANTEVVSRVDRAEQRAEERANRGPWRWALAALLLLAAVAAGLWYFTMGPGSPTVVPVVAGKTYEQAARELTTAHLNAKRVDAFDEKVAKGTVISGSPGPGAEVGRSTTVTLTVSKGPERYTVPELVGSTQTEAKARLEETRLALGKTSEAFDEKVPAGQIVSTTPKAGTAVKRGAAVSIVVSKGREPIQVQDFTGKPADQAVATLTDAGLQVDATKQEFSDDVPKGSVISQTPANGTLFRGEQVTLVVSKGPELVKVPNVQGKQLQEAQQILEGAGFQVKVENFMGGIFGTVRSQNPGPDAEVPKGSVVTLVVV